MSIPFELWRMELLHPPIVHFPIALLTVATALELVACVVRSADRRDWLRSCSLLLLFLGVLGAWLAVYTGNLAESIVNRVICDPEVSHEHQYWGELSTYLFSAALLIALARRYLLLRWASTPLVACLVIATAMLAYSGYLGGELVYRQGAGVYRPNGGQPDTNCSAFE